MDIDPGGLRLVRRAAFSGRCTGKQGYSDFFTFKTTIMTQAKYLILCANCAHPSGELKFFLLTDDDDNTAEFETREAAEAWCKEGDNSGLLAFTILCTNDFHFE